MSKPSTSGLTISRKTRRRNLAWAQERRLGRLDALAHCCRNIAALAGLLELDLVHHAAGMISDEVQRLRQLLEAFVRETGIGR